MWKEYPYGLLQFWHQAYKELFMCTARCFWWFGLLYQNWSTRIFPCGWFSFTMQRILARTFQICQSLNCLHKCKCKAWSRILTTWDFGKLSLATQESWLNIRTIVFGSYKASHVTEIQVKFETSILGLPSAVLVNNCQNISARVGVCMCFIIFASLPWFHLLTICPVVQPFMPIQPHSSWILLEGWIRIGVLTKLG
jgi:hypothetical protein